MPEPDCDRAEPCSASGKSDVSPAMVEAALAVLHRSGRLQFESEGDRDLVRSMLRVALVLLGP